MSVIPNSAKSDKARIEGNASFKKGRWAEAIGHYTNAALLSPKDPIALTNRSAAYLKLDKYEDALRDTSKALELDPVNLKALYRRSLARKGLGQLSEASDDLELVLKLDPNNDTALSELEEIKVSLQKLKASESSKKKNNIYSPPRATASISEINDSENDLASSTLKPTSTLPPTTIPTPTPMSAPTPTPTSKPTPASTLPVSASRSKPTPTPTSKPTPAPSPTSKASPTPTPSTASSNSFTALRQSRQVRKTFANGSSKPLESEVTARNKQSVSAHSPAQTTIQRSSITQSTPEPTSIPKPIPAPTSIPKPAPTPTPKHPSPEPTSKHPSPTSEPLLLPSPPSDPASTSPGTGLHLVRHLSSLPPPSAWKYLSYYPARNIPIILSPLLEPDVLGQLLLALREGSNGSSEDRERVQEIMLGLRKTQRFTMNMAMLSAFEKQAAQHAWMLSGHGDWP
ncbi:hypothetical protein BCR39DRAFT_367067 [Naematelia encephala]|uniref:RNA polymerase II-associated protein 3 n=1 Tax=Naematelia encephala TaxID=71784 RepID=A0A1Y2AL20_9TREE|nr:hypothetical protein BCR39DRAFT_367067 [Naematelia encephala]